MTKPGLWANIHAKRERIAAGSGERMRKPGAPGAPTADAFRSSSSDGRIDRALRAARKGRADGGEVTTADVRRMLSDQVTNRGMILPFADYADGTTRMAVPGVLYEPAAAWRRMMDSRYRPGDDEATRQLAEDSFTAASAAPVAGLAAAAVRPGVSLGSGGGKLPRSLPMDEASRMARAREMGFDTDTVWYHGTNRHIEEFDPTMIGTKTWTPSGAPRGFWFTKDAELAGRYAKGEDGQIVPVYLKDPIVLNNGRVAVAEDPSSIRSTRAAFDPDQIDSANLLAANSSKAATPGLAALESNRVRGGMPTYKGYHGTSDASKFEGEDRRTPYLMWMTGGRDDAAKAAASSYGEHAWANAPAVFPVEGRFENPMVVDAKGAKWKTVPFEGRPWRTDDLALEARKRNHDALVIENLLDHRATMGNELPARVIAAVRPGTVFDDYGRQVFANPSTASILALLDQRENSE